MRFFILIFISSFLFFGCQSDMRAKYIVSTHVSPRNTYRQLQTGERILNAHEGGPYDLNHDYNYHCNGRAKRIVDNSGYIVYMAGINSFMIKGHPYMAGCDGCDSCYKSYQKAGLIDYEILNEEYPYKKVRITLTKKGEKYALDNRMNRDCLGYDDVMADKKRGLRYVLFSYDEFSYKESSASFNFPTHIRASIWKHTKYTPFAKTLGQNDETGFASGYGDVSFYKYKLSGKWRQYRELSEQEEELYYN